MQGTKSSDRPPYRGLFINLERSVARRTLMEAQLQTFNLQDRYSRFAAVDGQALTEPPGAISASENACFQSHYRALESAKLSRRVVHILEDDVIFAPQMEQVIDSLDSSGLFEPFDLIFTHTFVGCELLLLRKFKELFDFYQQNKPPRLAVLDVKDDYRCIFASYLVPAPAIDKVLSVLKLGLDAGPKLPIDLFIGQEARAGRLRLGCIFPFITSVQLGDIGGTTITDRGQDTEITREIISLLQYSFFLGRDLKDIPPVLLNKLHAFDDDEHHKLITAVLGFVVSSDDFIAL
jgi:Glycosyltransferase family 25 (LPS biosynthesis protein)